MRQAREQAGLSLDDLAAQIKLARPTLDAIERDDFAQLNEPVYVRGYYRKLAKVLSVSEDELLAAYDSVAGQKAPPHPSKLILAGGADWGGGRQFNVRRLAVVIVLGLLIGVLMFWGSRRKEPESIAPSPVTPAPQAASSTMPTVSLVSQTPRPVEPADAVMPTTTGPAIPPAASEPAPAAATSPTVAAAPSVSTPAAAAPTPPTPAATPVTAAPTAVVPAAPPTAAPATASGNASVQLQFTGTSWAEVKDATGKMLLSGLVSSGNTQSLEGRAPFTVTLGNAPAVQVIFNGKAVEMAQYRRGDNTARFTLQ